jgi:hypothetical protein
MQKNSNDNPQEGIGEAMKSKNILTLFIFLFFIGITSNLFANSFAETFGFSAEGIARGNAMAAVANDWSSLWYNVAGLGKSRHITGQAVSREDPNIKLKKEGGGAEAAQKEIYPNQLAFAYLATIPRLELKIPKRFFGAYPNYYPVPTNAADKKPYGFISFGGVLDLKNIFPVPGFVSSMRLGFAMSVNQDFSLLKVSSIDPRDHNFIRFGRGIQRALILSGLGVGFFDDAFGMGIGVNFNFHGKGKLDPQLYLSALGVNFPQFPVLRNSLDLNLAPGAIAGIYANLGKFYGMLEGIEIGVSYRQENWFKQGPFNANNLINIMGIIQINAFYLMEILDFYSPHTVNAGIAYTRWDTTLSFEIDWEMWSNSAIRKDIKASYPGVPRFRDTLSYKAGIKYDTPLTWLSVMLGYSYVPSILPDYAGKKLGGKVQGINAYPPARQIFAGLINYMDNDKHAASVGLTFTVPKPTKPGKRPGQLYFTIAYQFQYLVPRTAKKFGDLRVLGTNAWFDSYLYNPSYTYGGMNHNIAVEAGTRL